MPSIRQLLVFCTLACRLSVVVATQASERESQSVEVTFYQLSTSEWSNVESSFKTLVAAEAATYCTNNAATCGLSSGFLFTTSEIGVYSGPTEESKSLKISFYIDFPTIHVLDSSSTTTYVVNSAAVTTILTNIRDSLETAVGADITYIAEEFYSIEPAATLNKALIPLAFIILLAVIILAIALHMWNKRKEREEKKKQRALDREKRKKTSRITPVYTMEAETKKSSNILPRRSRKKKVKQDSGSGANGNVPVLSMKTNMLTLDSSRAAQGNGAHYEDPVPLKTNALPPLPNPASEDETKEQKEERKREKKERKRRKREKRQHSANKDAADHDLEESETEHSKTESLEKNIVPVEDEPQVVA